MNSKQAVRLWEDRVGDSGEAPTEDELWEFALAVEEKARKPFVKLVSKWQRKAKELNAFGDNNRNTFHAPLAYEQSRWYTKFALKLQDRLDAQ